MRRTLYMGQNGRANARIYQEPDHEQGAARRLFKNPDKVVHSTHTFFNACD